MALKHRQNKSQKQRILIFNCSPIEEEEKSLVMLAKKMKKSNVSIDIIAFGELSDDTTRKLQAFSDNVQSAEGCYLATVPPSANLLSDSLITTPILGGDGTSSAGGGAGGGAGEGGASGGGGGNDFEFGVDPSVDPELALALRMSFEEEKARQEKEKKTKETTDGKSDLEPVAEGDEKQPLLDSQGQPSGSGSKDKKDDDDKMDTA